MDAQLDYGTLTALDRLGQRLLPGQARRVGRGEGDLTVLDGRVWLTGQGDCEDRVLEAGQRLRLAPAQAAVLESFDRSRPARVTWQPRASLFHRLGFFDFVGAAFAALARKAASSASRAQGCMACGDSIASSGALK